MSLLLHFLDDTEIRSIGRFQILDSGSLLIASTEASDVGKYTCSRMNSAGSVQESAYLTVLGNSYSMYSVYFS